MSREASKNDSIGRHIFVNVRHFEPLNLIIGLLTIRADWLLRPDVASKVTSCMFSMLCKSHPLIYVYKSVWQNTKSAY